MQFRELSDFIEINVKSHTSKDSQIDKSGNFYHVTQQGYNFSSIMSLNAAKYRQHMMIKLCEDNGVIPLCNVIMPNHTHDLFYAEKFDSIPKVMKILNSLVTRFSIKERDTKGQKSLEKLFMGLPSYERVADKSHLFYLFKYFYDNPAYLKETRQFVPFSCFDMWEKGYYKPYMEKVYILLFNKELSEIIEMCKTLSKDQFRIESERLFKGQSC